MGFEAKKKTFKLVFADPEMAGLEVRAKSPAMDVFVGLTKLADLDTGTVSIKDMPQIESLFEHFADCLISWNLEEDGVPVPTTKEGLYSQDLDFILEIIKAWVDAVASVPSPLGKPSGDGTQSPAVSIPMEPLSPSLAS